jgi:hypothetical protein
MKKLLALQLALIYSVCLVATTNVAYAGGETKEVCTDVKDKAGKEVKDSKTGKVKQSCKQVKTHKKVEGEKVPEKK